MPLRVLHVLDHSWPILDGYAQRSRSIVAAQKCLGMQPSVLTSSLHQQDDPTASDTELDGIRYWRASPGQALSKRAIGNRWPIFRELAVVRLLAKRLQSLLQSEAFDIIHAHSPGLCGIAAWRVARAHHLPFVYEIRSFWEDADLEPRKSPWKLLRYSLVRNLESFVVGRADAVVGIAEAVLKDLQSRGFPAEKLHHVPNGVETVRFSPRTRDSALAAALGVNGSPTLGFVGTLFPWEGIPWLVRAAAELHRAGSPFRLLIVGDGGDAANVRSAIREANADSYISFIGRVPHCEIERYYSVMDILIYPRRKSRITDMITPLKPLEAMALGKAVMGSDVGGIRELIQPEKTGLLFQPENIPDFCREAARLLNQPELRDILGKQAQRYVSEEKDWKIVARRYESVYEAAMRARRARG